MSVDILGLVMEKDMSGSWGVELSFIDQHTVGLAMLSRL